MLYLHAPNVHQGGGLNLLRALLSALTGPAVLQLDARFAPLPPLPEGTVVHHVAPRIIARLGAERRLARRLTPDDTVLCFGNLPPLWRVSARVVVFVQNVYLLDAAHMQALPWKLRARVHIERLWLKTFLRDAEVIVQTETMAQKAKARLHRPARVIPFRDPLPDPERSAAPEYDFIYVASGEAHKNHTRLFEAWAELAARGVKPSLALTHDPGANTPLGSALTQARAKGARIEIVSADGVEAMAALYAKARFLVFPSMFESFGLPLLEAAQIGLPIVAAERDYVRDVVQPKETFDPLSARSIARAVLRALDQATEPPVPRSAAEFLDALQERA